MSGIATLLEQVTKDVIIVGIDLSKIFKGFRRPIKAAINVSNTEIAIKAISIAINISISDLIVLPPIVKISDVIEQNTTRGINFITAVVICIKIVLHSSRNFLNVLVPVLITAQPSKIASTINCSISPFKKGLTRLSGKIFIIVSRTETEPEIILFVSIEFIARSAPGFKI